MRFASPGILAAILVLCVLLSPDAEGNEELSPSEAARTVAKRIGENYQQLRDVRAVVEHSFENKEVAKEETVTHRRADGAEITFTKSPGGSRTRRCAILDGKLKVEVTSGKELQAVRLYESDKVTEFVPRVLTAWVRRLDEMPGSPGYDPREPGNIRESVPLRTLLHEANVQESRWTGRVGEIPVLALRLKPANGETVLLHCDPARNLLPIMIAFLHQDGSINVCTIIEYLEIIPATCWFPALATRTIYPKPGMAKTPGAPGFTSKDVSRLKSITNHAGVTEADVKLDLPAGTSVRDNLLKQIYQVGD